MFSSDLGYEASYMCETGTKNETRYITQHVICFTICDDHGQFNILSEHTKCFTILVCLFMFMFVHDTAVCLFINSDLDRYRARKNGPFTLRDQEDPKSQIRSHRVTLSSKCRLP